METPLHERLLTLFFAALLFLNVGYVLVGIASIPLYYERVTTLTIEPYVFGGHDVASNALVQHEAAKRGLMLTQYAVEQLVFSLVFALPIVALATFIVWRARWNWFAWYSAIILLFIAEYALASQVYVARLIPPPLYDANAVFWPLVLLYFFLFPNGKAVPRGALWLVVPVSLLHLAYQVWGAFLEFLPLPQWVAWSEAFTPPIELLIGLEVLLILVCQVYRYRRASSPLEKQQTKWFVVGLMIFPFAFVPLLIPTSSFPFTTEVGLLWFAFLPLSIGIAILRYRLWDIDVIIRRTLVYGTLTVILTLVYVALVIGLQALLRGIISQDSGVAIVISTLAIAALFQPLRRRIQRVIDRRFYRSKYDAAKTVAAFSATLRQEVDLEQLREHLLAVVQETMQPSHVSLWLRPPQRYTEEPHRLKRPHTMEEDY
jgi:hypothetical protein